MIEKLKNLALIQMGCTFRSRIEAVDHGRIAVIQMKDLDDNNRVNCSGLVKVEIEKIGEHHLARQGDLIFRSRGQITTSAILADDPGDVVVAAPLLRIRPNYAIILPEYLNWFINQLPAQNYLASQAHLAGLIGGTTQKMIGIQALGELDVLVPAIDCQRMIAELAALGVEEQDLMERLSRKRREYISVLLMEMAKGEQIYER